MMQRNRCDAVMSESGQNLRLPQRNIGGRLTSVSRHYASEAIQPFVAPSMSSLDSDFVLRAFKSLDRLSRKRGVAEPSTPPLAV